MDKATMMKRCEPSKVHEKHKKASEKTNLLCVSKETGLMQHA
jgi:hypothetical protein